MLFLPLSIKQVTVETHIDLHVNLWCTNSSHRVDRAKIFTVARSIFGSSIWNILYVTFWFLEFLEI